jgi:hypothetical protein
VPKRKEAPEAIIHIEDHEAPDEDNICDELNKNGGRE